MNRRGLLWALALLFLCDLAMPLWPGAFQFEGQSLEIARRVSVQAASADLPPLPHRFPAIAQAAPRIASERTPRREANHPAHFDLHPIRSPQYEADSLTAVDPA